MAEASRSRTGAEILVDQMRVHGVEVAFGVPGESYLAVLDALADPMRPIRFITCRHEAAAANMAEAYGKLTGRPGIAMVTRGPGACHASIGVHTAAQDSTPMILLVGQVARGVREREAFQEVDYRQMFGGQAKWVVDIEDPERIPEFMARAFKVATSGRPGPVVMALPEDMLTQHTAAEDAPPFRRTRITPDPALLLELRERLAGAKRPLVVAGGADWTAPAGEALLAFAAANELPVTTAFRRQDAVDNSHPNHVGNVGLAMNPELADALAKADLVIAIGPRLGEITTAGYSRMVPPNPAQALIHIHPSADELGRVYQPVLAIAASMAEACRGLAALDPIADPAWASQTQRLRASYLRHIMPVQAPGALNMSEVIEHLRKTLPADTIITNGAGNYAAWLNRFSEFTVFPSQLAPTSGAMGYGYPAALAAKVLHPDRVVLSVNGDGCFMMCAQELATAAMYGLDPIALVVNNGMYGTIRMHQEREYPGQVSGTDLKNPDFAAMARVFGLHGEIVERTADFPGALERARAAGKASVIELRIDPEALTPSATLSQIREAGIKRRGQS